VAVEVVPSLQVVAPAESAVQTGGDKANIIKVAEISPARLVFLMKVFSLF
jgi:hypothetical protein